jgi:hypothetical protein
MAYIIEEEENHSAAVPDPGSGAILTMDPGLTSRIHNTGKSVTFRKFLSSGT